MSGFRLGLAGAGRMGRTHIRALAGSDLVTITAVAEPFQRTREQLAASAIAVHASVAEMLDAGNLDGVLICAPTDQHRDVIGQVAAAGLPILCEKPCGLNSAQTRAAAGLAAPAGVPLQIAYWRRYVPGLRSLRERIANGELGMIHMASCHQWDQSPPAAAFRAHSGGIFVDMGVHEFDQLRWLTGQDIGGVQAAAVCVPPDQAITGDVDSAQAIAQLSGGTVGIVSLGRYHPVGDMVRAEVFGTSGAARCDVIRPQDGERAQLDALRLQAEDFAVLARGGTGSGATAADAVAALEAAERASAAIPALAAGP